MPDLNDGQSLEMQGSARRPYVLKNVGGAYSCTCPAWRNQALPIERRTCKHLRRLRGDAAEAVRVGGTLPVPPAKAAGRVVAPPLLLAQSWDGALDPAGWWLSEKLDGVRAYFDGRQFLSRQGHRYHAPDWFGAGLPAVPLDGELWLARKQFQRTVGIVRRHDATDLWKEIQFLIFDIPALDEPFERRLFYLLDLIRQHRPPFAWVHSHVRCRGLDHLHEELARVEALGGEGLMLRQPASRYETGRSPTLLKVKRFHDAEARVIGYTPGTGRHRGRLGALRVQLANGVQFAVGSGLSDAERASPPTVGSIITFRYQELSDAGVPRFPTYVGVRVDPTPSFEKGAEVIHALPSAVRHFESVGGRSCQFWEIQVRGPEVVIRFGRIGSQGRTQTRHCADVAAAARFAENCVREKRAQGYQETT